MIRVGSSGNGNGAQSNQGDIGIQGSHQNKGKKNLVVTVTLGTIALILAWILYKTKFAATSVPDEPEPVMLFNISDETPDFESTFATEICNYTFNLSIPTTVIDNDKKDLMHIASKLASDWADLLEIKLSRFKVESIKKLENYDITRKVLDKMTGDETDTLFKLYQAKIGIEPDKFSVVWTESKVWIIGFR